MIQGQLKSQPFEPGNVINALGYIRQIIQLVWVRPGPFLTLCLITCWCKLLDFDQLDPEISTLTLMVLLGKHYPRHECLSTCEKPMDFSRVNQHVDHDQWSHGSP